MNADPVTLGFVRGKWIAWTAAIVAGLVAGGLWLRHRKPPQAPSTAAAATVVLPSSITLTGKVRAAHITSVGAQLPGNIDAFEVNVGDEVSQGQVLAEIGGAGLETARADAVEAVQKAQNRVEDAEKAVAATQLEASRAHADAERSRAALDRAQKLFDRQKTLFQAGATPRLTFEKAEREYESARQEWEAVDKAQRTAAERVQDTLKQLQNARKILMDKNEELEDAQGAVAAGSLESPVDGLVVGRRGEIGQPAPDDLFQIATDLYDLEVVVEPKPEVRKSLRPHQPALVIIPDLQGTGYPGEVKSLNENAAVIGFESPTPAIRPGMVAEVRLKPE